ncbi:MAG: archaetidylserine decarboxylase [Proteobacteria bacterium]|nr:archaetidylserine decarboxylase [Cystobacterineae bacterium]MCL2258646.1 archaetidylserine decarboxylase [Cystobacterineae bacterium]MCL2314939.1 archaetidylserine decarboxylase [Pseudomonadota bacterium]
MKEQAFLTLMRLLPKSTLSSVVGRLVNAKLPKWMHRRSIAAFAKRYAINLDEAEKPIEAYASFAEFFSRKLKPGIRPIDAGDDAIVSPVDARISQFGKMEADKCVQAKGIWFSAGQLLGCEGAGRCFEGGSFLTLYLSPRDYHRIHAPLDGEIASLHYLPGAFWPVHPIAVRNKEALYSINERLFVRLQTRIGKVALVAVGATCVGRIVAAFDGHATHEGKAAYTKCYATPLPVKKGEELLRFEMGSTVILLFEKGRVQFGEGLELENMLRVGQKIGSILPGNVLPGSVL